MKNALEQTYNYYIVEGLQECLALKSTLSENHCQLIHLRKTGDNKSIKADYWHNHVNEEKQGISMLGGILSDKSPTLFLNLDQAARDNSLCHVKVRLSRHLGEKCKPLPYLQDAQNRKSFDMLTFTDELAHKRRIKEYIRNDIVIGQGDLAIWAEDGLLLHRAIPPNQNNAVHDPEKITRIVHARAFLI